MTKTNSDTKTGMVPIQSLFKKKTCIFTLYEF